MDSSREKAFFVHLPDKIIRFKQMSNNLYGMDPLDTTNFISKKEYNEKNVQYAGVGETSATSDMDDNMKYLSERQ